MNYVFCGAYKGLLFGLYLKHSGEKITIVTDNKDLIQYCKVEKIDYIKSVTSLAFADFYKILNFKKKLDETIEKIDIKKEDAFFILGSVKGYGYYYLAKELSKKCDFSYYKSVDLEGRELKKFKPPWYKPIFIRGGVLRIVMKIFLGLDLKYYDANTILCLGITDDFLIKYNIKEYEPEHSGEDLIFKGLKASNKKFKEYDNLIIDQGPLVNYVEFDSLKQLNKKILKLPIKFAFKKHPNSLNETEFKKKYYKIFDNCKILSKYMPVELFLINNEKSVIAVFSTSLITASKFDNLKSVSLLELVKWHNKKTKEEWRQTLSKASKNKILFPNTFEELKEILLKP